MRGNGMVSWYSAVNGRPSGRLLKNLRTALLSTRIEQSVRWLVCGRCREKYETCRRRQTSDNNDLCLAVPACRVLEQARWRVALFFLLVN